jgi:hypothetical protein
MAALSAFFDPIKQSAQQIAGVLGNTLEDQIRTRLGLNAREAEQRPPTNSEESARVPRTESEIRAAREADAPGLSAGAAPVPWTIVAALVAVAFFALRK